jgi:hypothetical protein
MMMISLESKPKRSVFRILVLCFLMLFTLVPIASATVMPDPVTNLHLKANGGIEWTNPTTPYTGIRIILVNRTTNKQVHSTIVSAGTTTYNYGSLDSSKRYMYTLNTILNGVYSSYASLYIN